MEFETNIGLEIHAELSTKTKAFCSCKVAFGGEANTRCCPVCMGFPGALPYLNEDVVKKAVKTGLATNCSISTVSKNARKNYFYPDLPKGYQISQSEKPICQNGFLTVKGKKIRINRIHIEEDAGKLVHEGNCTKIDYNRAGVPLIEIVTEPDISSCEETKEFLDKIKNILMFLDVSDCKMQEGSLRCDVNVSVREKGQRELSERCEMKNINSFSAVLRCIEYEELRQKQMLTKGLKVLGETRRWDDEKGESVLLRDKESAADYRYFPEPDIPYIYIEQELIKKIKKDMPLLPEERKKMYVEKFKLSNEDAKNIVKKKSFTSIFEDAIECGMTPKKAANWLLGDVSEYLNNNHIDAEEIFLTGRNLAQLQSLIDNGTISQSKAKEVLLLMFKENREASEIVKENNFTQISDRSELIKLVRDIILENEKSVADYRNGKKNAFGYLMGQCMRKSNNQANPEMIRKILEEML